MNHVLFIPLDDRPATRDAVLDLVAAAGVEVLTPDRAMLGGRDRGADVPALWNWLHALLKRSAPPAACIAAAEMLCFGGLVATHRSTRHWRNVLPWLDEIHALAERTPTYLSSVIPRIPTTAGGGEDPAYWETHGDGLREYAAAADRYSWMGDAASKRNLAETLARLPAEVIEALFEHRRRHLLINAELLLAAARGPIRALLIGQDDTPAAGLSRMDREALERLAARAAAGAGRSGTLLTSGADELGAVLFARWLNESVTASPGVRVAYTFPAAAEHVAAYESAPLAQSVREHIVAAGCKVVERGEEILLWVHNFEEERQREAADQPDPEGDTHGEAAAAKLVLETADPDRTVAVADVRYANGADRALVEALLRRAAAAGIGAYAGWNTAGNALGSAVAQAVVVHHLNRRALAGSLDAARRMVLARLLDDWGYQAVVRPRLAALLAERGGDPARLGTQAPFIESTAAGIFAEEIAPALSASFDHRVTVRRIAFPWERLFEAAIDFELAAIHV